MRTLYCALFYNSIKYLIDAILVLKKKIKIKKYYYIDEENLKKNNFIKKLKTQKFQK